MFDYHAPENDLSLYRKLIHFFPSENIIWGILLSLFLVKLSAVVQIAVEKYHI